MFFMVMLLTSRKLLNLISGRQDKYGCPSNGRNIGAEKLLSANPKLNAELKKAGKFNYGIVIPEH